MFAAVSRLGSDGPDVRNASLGGSSCISLPVRKSRSLPQRSGVSMRRRTRVMAWCCSTNCFLASLRRAQTGSLPFVRRRHPFVNVVVRKPRCRVVRQGPSRRVLPCRGAPADALDAVASSARGEQPRDQRADRRGADGHDIAAPLVLTHSRDIEDRIDLRLA